MPPFRGIGIRIGSPAATSRGMQEAEMRQIATWLVDVLRQADDDTELASLASRVKDLYRAFPVPGLDASMGQSAWKMIILVTKQAL